MFSTIAPRYDRVNHVISFRSCHAWRKQAVDLLNLKPGDSALDLCSGTGDFLKPLRNAVGPFGTLLALDFALPMLQIGTKKDTKANFVAADALRAPCAPNSFEGITIGWGVRNVADIDALHREAFRLLKPGGRFVSLETAVPKNPFIGSISKIGLRILLPLIGWLAGSKEAYAYLGGSTERFANRENLKASMEQAGFTEVTYQDRMFGNICIHLGRKP
jgi:demethylmenaquinone methyltransferase/2-methoxy-6-polyprenyl-1,4-benzoquinol methylase